MGSNLIILKNKSRMKRKIELGILIVGIIGLISWISSAEKMIQEQPNVESKWVADVQLADGTTILNAPSGKDWSNYDATGVYVYDYSDTVIIDDSDTARIYYGVKEGKGETKWRISTSGVFGPDPVTGSCNCSWTVGPWDYAIVKFTNTRRFEWWGELMEHHGMVNIYFDESGWEERTGRRTLVADNLDTYSPDNLSPTLNWYADSLDVNKVYEFYMIPTGNKNPASTGTPVVIQGFKLINDPLPSIT